MTASSSPRWVKIVGIAVVLALPLALAISYLTAVFDSPESEPSDLTEHSSGPRPMSTPFISRGLRQPPLVPAHDALIPDAEEVVGILVAGVPRAYHLASMNTLSRMVINDVVGELPVTITYDRAENIVQVFTKKGTREPLAVEVGGMFHGKLLLRYDGRFFFQATGRALTRPDDPDDCLLETMPFQRTRWQDWRQRHPQTEVFYLRPE